MLISKKNYTKPNLKLSVFCQFQVGSSAFGCEWPAAADFIRFQTEVREREPNMADNVEEKIDNLSLGDSKNVRTI